MLRAALAALSSRLTTKTVRKRKKVAALAAGSQRWRRKCVVKKTKVPPTTLTARHLRPSSHLTVPKKLGNRRTIKK